MLIPKSFRFMNFLMSDIDKKRFRRSASVQGSARKLPCNGHRRLTASARWGGLRGVTIVLAMLLIPFWGLAQESGLRSGPNILEQYLEQAAENNPELKAQFQQYLSALQQVPQVNTLPDPELSFGYFISPIETRVGPQQARFGITQMFPWFGTLETRGRAASQMAKARFEEFRSRRNRLFYEVQEKWYQLYQLDQTIEILNENIQILDTYESIALQKYETDQVGQADVLRVQIEKEDLKTRLALEKDNRRVAARAFNTLLNRPPDQSITVADTLAARQLPKPEAELERAVRQQNPELTETEYKAAAARSSIKAARKAGMPTFGVGVDYLVTASRSTGMTDNGKDAILARAGIQLPLFRGKYRAREKQARIELRGVQYRQEAVSDRLQTELDRALRDYREGDRRVRLYKEIQIQRTRQAIKILTEEYAAAATDFEELLRLQRKLLDYELSRDQALVKQNTAVAQIEYLYGKYNVNPGEIETTIQ